MINSILKIKWENLPNKPGCYLFYNNSEQIIYVGKAINLQKRVGSYFSKKINNFKTIQLVNEIYDIKFIITENEKEALLLESNLIKKHKPRYNILLNDDKKYPYIVITKEQDPEIKLVRNRLKKYSYQFGPFPDGTKAYEILKLIKRLYPLRSCKGNLNKPCLNYQINQCLGACFKKVEDNIYKNNINKIKSFFKGNNKSIKKELESKMLNYAKNFQFEEAEKIKNIISKIDFSTSKQLTNISRTKNTDYITTLIRDNYLIISIYFYRNGELLSKDYKIFEYYDLDVETVTRVYITQLYNKIIIPENIMTDIILDELSMIFNTKIFKPKNSEDKKIIKKMQEESSAFLDYNLKNDNNTSGKELLMLNKLQELIKMPKLPVILEMYDISNIKTEAQVAGVVVYKNGLPSYNDFRCYKLPDSLKSDYERMMELAKLRFIKNTNNSFKSDLIIVDGGIIQINAIRKILPLELDEITIIGLVKNNKHNTDHIILENKEKISIEDKTLFNYLSNIQDKVHNLAINYHRKIRKEKLF